MILKFRQSSFASLVHTSVAGCCSLSMFAACLTADQRSGRVIHWLRPAAAADLLLSPGSPRIQTMRGGSPAVTSNMWTICDGRGIHKLGYIMWGLSALTLPLVPAVKLANCEYHYISNYPILPSLQSLNTNNVLSEQSGRSWGGSLILISILGAEEMR